MFEFHFLIYTDHKSLEYLSKISEHKHRAQVWFELLTAYVYELHYRSGAANGNADFLSYLSLPSIEGDYKGPYCLTDRKDVVEYPVADASGINLVSAECATPESDLLAHYLLNVERRRVDTGSPAAPKDIATYLIRACGRTSITSLTLDLGLMGRPW